MAGAAPGRPVEIRLLGQVEAGQGGRTLSIGGPKQRAMLALFALEPGRTITTDQLVDDVWGERSPASVRTSVRVHVFRLRQALEVAGAVETIATRTGGYAFVGDPASVDLHRFTVAVQAARNAARAGPDPEALDLARHAMTLWHGVPLAGLHDIPFVPARVTGMVGQWLDLVELATDLELRCGSPARVLPTLERLVVEHPYRESLWVRLAHVLYRSGRQADALSRLKTLRHLLVDDLGLEPSAEVRAVERAILRQEPGLLASDELTLRPTSAGARPTIVSTGREARPSAPWAIDAKVDRPRVREELDAALSAGHVVVVGEAGAGKTTLLDELRPTGRGGEPVVVRVAAVSEPLRAMDVVASIIEQLEAAFPAEMGDAVARPRLGAARARLAGHGPVTTEAPTTRDELLADLATLICHPLDARDPVLVIDDCHWLESSSVEVIGLVLRQRRHRVALTSRRDVADLGPAWAEVPVIRLGGFDRDEIDAMVQIVAPHRHTPELADDLRRQTGGNPLFLTLVLGVLADERGEDMPESVTDAVHERVSGLSRATREALQFTALLGHSFLLEPLQRARPGTIDQLREAELEGLVHIDDADGSGAFLHGLVAEALAAAVSPGLRVAWHDELCRALLASGYPAVAAAVHAVGAADLDAVRAADLCRRAGTERAVLFEWREAIEWARRGLDLIDRFGMGGQLLEAELHGLVGTGLRRTATAGSEVELLWAAEIADAVDAGELLVRVITELCLHGPTSRAGTVDEAARAMLDRALDHEVGDAARAELLSAASTLLTVSDDSALGRSLYLEALDAADRSDDPVARRAVHLNAHLGLAHPDDLARRWDAVAALDQFDDTESRWESQFLRFGLALAGADRRALDRSVDELRRLTPEVRARQRDRGLLQVEAAHALVAGDLRRAERCADEAVAACLESYSESWSISIYAALILPIRDAQGRVPELARAVDGLLAATPAFITWSALSACIGYASNDRDRMHRDLATLRRRQLALAEDVTWTAVATIVCRPIWAMGETDLAAVLYERLRPFGDQMSWNGLSTHGPVDAGLACLADTLGDRAAADTHRRQAAAAIDRLDAPHLAWPELSRIGLR